MTPTSIDPLMRRSVSKEKRRWTLEQGESVHERSLLPAVKYSSKEVAARQLTKEISAPSGYQGKYVDVPRKYTKGPLQHALGRADRQPAPQRYVDSCGHLGANVNTGVYSLLVDSQDCPLASSQLLGGETVDFHKNYVGERGFIALLPLLDRNTAWTHLNASQNGLRNEAILHLTDVLLRPAHQRRWVGLDLSRNPISDGAARMLMEMVGRRGYIRRINLAHTKVSGRVKLAVQALIDANQEDERQRATTENCNYSI